MSNIYLGIDASKGYADFALLNEQQAPVAKGFQLDDTSTGHQQLITYLRQFVTAHPGVTITAGVESTGGYENNWYRRLATLSQQLPVRIARLNPAHVKYHSQGNARRTRTDQTSAQDIAQYIATHNTKVVYNEPETLAQLRRMWSHIQLLAKQRTQLLNHLETVLYNGMPELLTYCRHGMPQWLLRVLVKYPTYEQLRRAPWHGCPMFPSEKHRTCVPAFSGALETVLLSPAPLFPQLQGGSLSLISTLLRPRSSSNSSASTISHG